MKTIAIVDYGMGNLRSVAKAFMHVAPDQRVLITSEVNEIEAADRVVLPGQAAMPESMAALNASGLRSVLDKVSREKPLLGVCLGLQMFFATSEEGPAGVGTPALGWIPGKVVRFPKPHVDVDGRPLKVPHMGWNAVRFPGAMAAHPCWAGLGNDRGDAAGTAFYFAHGFYAVPEDPTVVAGVADYPNPLCVAVARANIFAVQFHPEKSADAGLRVLKNFSMWNGSL